MGECSNWARSAARFSLCRIVRQRGQEAREGFEGEREDYSVGGEGAVAAADGPAGVRLGRVDWLDGVDAGAQEDFAAAGAQVVDGASVEIAERDAGNAHASGFGREQERFAKDLCRRI